MLVSCKHCGGVHNRGVICAKKIQPKRLKKEDTSITRFRASRAWKKKRAAIRERDKQLCQICLTERFSTIRKYNFELLEVHHIEPLVENWSARLLDNNLITLCVSHHKMAENGIISRAILMDIVKNTYAF